MGIHGEDPADDVQLVRVRGELDASAAPVREHPDVAEAEHILATPLLVRLRPEPVRRIVGDLGDLDQVVEALYLPAKPAARP